MTVIAPLVTSKAPNLSIAPPEYSKQYADMLNNILRLYFNQIDNALASLSGNVGGAYLRFPNGAFHQNGVTTLTANMSNVSTADIQVTSTALFLSAGALIIGTELIGYTGKTSTTFTGITRGVYGSTNTSHTAGAYVSEAQSVPSPTSPLTVAMTSTDVSNQVTLDPIDNTKVVYEFPGYYNIQFSAQLISFANTIDNVTMWFRQNGVDIANSAGIVSIPTIHAGVAGAAIVSWNLVIPINAGDYVQLMMSSDSGNTVAATYPPGVSPAHPASPSIILTSTFVSALY
jgi:azurin